MKRHHALILIAGLLAAPLGAQSAQNAATEATAATPPTIQNGAILFGSDGRRIGRIDRIRMEGDKPLAVNVIYNGRYVTIPAATISSGDHGLTTSLTKAELAKL